MTDGRDLALQSATAAAIAAEGVRAAAASTTGPLTR